MNPPEENQPVNKPKSKWPKILAIGCGGFLVLLVLAVVLVNSYIKRSVADLLEQKMTDSGLNAQIGEFDYSILDRQVSIHNLTATPSGGQFAGMGQLTIDEVSLQIDPNAPNQVGHVIIRGGHSTHFSVGEVEVQPGKSLKAKSMVLKNLKGLGKGDLLKITEMQVKYGVKGLDLLKLDVAELIAFQTADGEWNSLVRPVKELKFMGKKVDHIGEIIVSVKAIKVLNLASGGTTQTIPANKTIHVRDISNAAEFNSQFIPALQSMLSEVAGAAQR